MALVSSIAMPWAFGCLRVPAELEEEEGGLHVEHESEQPSQLPLRVVSEDGEGRRAREALVL